MDVVSHGPMCYMGTDALHVSDRVAGLSAGNDAALFQSVHPPHDTLRQFMSIYPSIILCILLSVFIHADIHLLDMKE